MRAMARHDALIAEKRRILQLETLYDLAIALHAQRPEQELVDELLQRVCAVLDPGAAVAVTRDAYGGGARGGAGGAGRAGSPRSAGWMSCPRATPCSRRRSGASCSPRGAPSSARAASWPAGRT